MLPGTPPMHLTLSLGDQHGASLAAGCTALAQQAERQGLALLLLGSPAADTVVLLGSLVAPTRCIGLGARLDVAPTEPFHSARAFAVLDNLSEGRTAWWLNLRPPVTGDGRFGHRPVLDTAAHYARAEEYIHVALRLWDSWEHDAVVVDKAAGLFADARKIHPIHHRGTHFQVRGPLTAVRPLQGHPVLVVDDLSPEGQRISARHADVVLADCHQPEQARALATALRAQASATGRPPGSLRVLPTLRLDAQEPADRLLERITHWHGACGCDGLHLEAMRPADANTFLEAVLPRLQAQGLCASATNGTLRDRLGLPVPGNHFAQEAA